MTKPHVSRVNQIDAAQLDEEIYKILKSQAQEITKLYPQEKVEEWQPEIDAALKFAIWWFSLGKGNSTFGQRLLDLNYANINGRKAILMLILEVVPIYLKERFASRRRVGDVGRDERLKNWIDTVGNIFSLLSFLNLLNFIHSGTQPSIIEKILGISSENTMKKRPRNIGYSYMTRELLWHSLMELFNVGLPLINFHAIKRKLLRFWLNKRTTGNFSIIRPIMNTRTLCPYCNESPILPRHADCEHIYCHYCIEAHFAAMDSFECLACGAELHSKNVKVYTPSVEPAILLPFDDEAQI